MQWEVRGQFIFRPKPSSQERCSALKDTLWSKKHSHHFIQFLTLPRWEKGFCCSQTILGDFRWDTWWLVVIVNTWASLHGCALWHEQLHYNSAGANSSLQDCNNPVATGSLPSSISLPLPPHKTKIAIMHHPRLVADLGLSHWSVCVSVCMCACVTRSQLLFSCPVETGLGRLHPVSPCPLPLSSSLSISLPFSL